MCAWSKSSIAYWWSMLTMYDHIIFIVYSNIPRITIKKLDNSLESLPHLPRCDWFDHDLVVYSKSLTKITTQIRAHRKPRLSPIFVESSCLKNLSRSSDFASWDFLSIHMASMLSKLLLSGSQMTSEHILRDVKTIIKTKNQQIKSKNKQ